MSYPHKHVRTYTSHSHIHKHTRSAVMLLWFVDKKVAELAVKDGVLIDEECIECQPERVTDAIADENVDVCMVRKFFTYEGWMIVEQVVHEKVTRMKWKCNMCHHDLSDKLGESVACDCCLLWFHFSCVGLTKHPKTKNCFCRAGYSRSTTRDE